MKNFSALVILSFACLAIVSAFPTAERNLDDFEHNCMADLVLKAKRLQRRVLRRDGGAAEYGYDGEEGPAFWADLDPKNALCRSGQMQSPINFPGKIFNVNGSSPLEFKWMKSLKNVEMLKEKFTVKVFMPDQNSKLVYNGVEYHLAQFHFHTPSEHHVDGHAYDGEVHFVHLSAEGKILVVGAFLDIQTSAMGSPFLTQIIKSLQGSVNTRDEKVALKSLDLGSISMFFAGASWNSYEGSLTTPPCLEGVRFFISRKRIYVSDNELDALRKFVKFSARYTQAYHGRGGIDSEHH